MPSDDVNEMMLGISEDISVLLHACPNLEVAALADGAPEMWTLIDVAGGVIEADHGHRPHMHVDFWLLVEKLAPAAMTIHGEEEGGRVLARWRTRLLNRHGAACQIRQELIDAGRSTGRTGNPVHDMRRLARTVCPSVAAPSRPPVVAVRMKRSARWKDETGRHACARTK